MANSLRLLKFHMAYKWEDESYLCDAPKHAGKELVGFQCLGDVPSTPVSASGALSTGSPQTTNPHKAHT